jgi:hypothetical protein
VALSRKLAGVLFVMWRARWHGGAAPPPQSHFRFGRLRESLRWSLPLGVVGLVLLVWLVRLARRRRRASPMSPQQVA